MLDWRDQKYLCSDLLHAIKILADVNAAIAQWGDFAETVAAPASDIARIQEHLTKV